MNSNEVTLQFSLDLRRVADGVSRMVEQFGRLETTITGGAKSGQTALNTTEASSRKLSEGLQETARSAQRLEGSSNALENSTVRLAAHVATTAAALRSLKGFMEEVLSTTMNLEKAQRTLQYATGDGAAAMAWVRRTSQELGLELMSAAQAYAKLSAATRGTRLEGRETQTIFKAVASAATVMGLSAEETSGALLAITQMVSKGKVAAEELRGQLGERLPGALAISARALGVTTTQLDKMLEQGQVIASDFLPKFARELQRTLGDQTALAALGPTAQLNRLKTAFTDLLAAIGNGGAIQQASKDMGDLANSLKGAAENGVPRELGGYLANAIGLTKTLATVLWTCRHEVLGLAAAYGIFLAMKIAGGIFEWLKAQKESISALFAEQEQLVRNAVAKSGLTYQTNQSALAQVRHAQALVVSRLAAVQTGASLGELTAAEATEQRQALLTAQAELAKAEAVANSGRAAGLASAATKALGGPIGWITLLLTAGVGAWVAWGGASETAADMARKASEKAEKSRQTFEGLTGDIQGLNATLNDSKAKLEDKKRAQEQLNTVVKQLLLVYPDLNSYIKKEGENYTLTLDDLKKFTTQKKLDAEASVRNAEAKLKETQALIAYAKAQAAAAFTNRMPGREGIAVAVGESRRWSGMATEQAGELEKLQASLNTYLESLKKWQEQDARLNAPATPQGREDGTPKKAKKVHQITDAEVNAEIQTLEAASMRRVTLEEQEAAEIEAIRADRDRKLASFQEKLKAKSLNQVQYDRLETAERTAAVERMARVEEKYATERQKLQEELQGKLTASEEGGLARRYAAIEKTYADIRRQNNQLRLEGQAPFLTEEAILKAEDAAKVQARLDQVREDVRLLREELSRLAQEKGRALTDFEKQEVLGRWKGAGGTKATASDQVARQERIGGTGWEGAAEGSQEWLAKSTNAFQSWKTATQSMLGGLQEGFASFYASLTTRGMSWGQRWTALWKSISGSAVSALSQIMAKETALWLVQKAKQAWEDLRSTKQKAQTAQDLAQSSAKTAAATTETGANVGKAASETFAAHASIPWVGIALAVGMIALMMATMSSLKARAVGGLVTRPEITLLGEAGPELVAPESDFKDWAKGMVFMGANLQANIQASQDRTLEYHLQAASYAREAQTQGDRNMTQGRPFAGGASPTIDLRGARIFTSNSTEMGDFLHEASTNWARLNG